MSKTYSKETSFGNEIAFIIKLPKKKDRNPVGMFQERKQVIKDRREKRSKDARTIREQFETWE